MHRAVVVYHGDNDGFCCAFLLHLAYADVCEIDFIEFSHGYEDAVVARADDDADMFICDIGSLDLDQIRIICNKCMPMTVHIFDHHKSSAHYLDILQPPSNLFVRWDQGKAACKLVFEHVAHLIEDESIRTLVDYVESRDLWKLDSLPNARAIIERLCLAPRDFESWRRFAHDLSDKDKAQILIREGELLLEQKQRLVNAICEKATICKFAGHVVPIVQSNLFASDVGNQLCPGYPLAIIWRESRDRFVYELRSDADGVDVSEIAVAFGGGGHKHAAGFSIDARRADHLSLVGAERLV